MEIKKPENPPVYPCKIKSNEKNGPSQIDSTGMTLRDYLAAKAMQGLMSTQHVDGSPGGKDLAEWAYKTADEMLTEREK